MTSTQDVALMRLVAQRLVGPGAGSPSDVVRHLAAVQAQDLPGALTSVALRTATRAWSEVVDALGDGTVVRSWPMRGTLHLVLAVDLVWMLGLMTARPLAAAARRRVDLGIDDAALLRARGVVEGAAVGGARRADLLAAFEAAGLPTSGGRGYHLLAHLAQTGVLCLGPMADDEQLFVLVDEWVPAPRRLEREEALGELARRYLGGHGPATVQDLARWSGLPLGDVRAGLAVAAPDLDTLDLDGVTYHLDPRTPTLTDELWEEASGVLLLPGFDEVVLGYADRSATVPPEHAAAVVPGGNGVFRPTVLSGGRAVATWRVVGTGRRRRVETEPFVPPLPAGVLAALPDAIAALPLKT